MAASKYVFIRKPFFILAKIRRGIGSFQNNFTLNDIDLLWEFYKPTTQNCTSYFDLDEAILPAEERVASFLKRFIAGASDEMLQLLLQYATGSANVEYGSFLKYDLLIEV